MVYSTRLCALCLTWCYFVRSCVFQSFFAITSLGREWERERERERANLSGFRTVVRFALVWFCLFLLPLGVWEGLRFVIVALPGLFSYFFLNNVNLIFVMGKLFKLKFKLISLFLLHAMNCNMIHLKLFLFFLVDQLAFIP